MKKALKYFIILFVGALFMSACEPSEYLKEGEFFHLSHKGAKMPVWVQGNFNSDVIIISNHGGPGDSGMEHHIAPGFQLLEEDYLIVYWDQRYSGMTQGRYDLETQTPDQMIEDTEKLVELIQQKYPGKKLFMIGHSWGGQLSPGYLGRDNHADMFKGWIDVDGSIYGDMESQLMKDYIMERLPEAMAKPDADLEFWQVIIDFYEENPLPGNYSAAEPYFYSAALGGDVYDIDKYYNEFEIPYVQLIFKSMFSMSFYIDAFSSTDNRFLWDELNYTPELENITIPSLLLWGIDDGIVPVEVADYVYEHLGTDPSQKHVVKIEECAHAPHIEQPEIFYQEVSSFVETYKNK
ncbi:alpha/beta fold hydrolase [Bacteroidota bacterium]